MRYVKTLDIYTFPRELLKHLQRGQWVCAGVPDENRANCGVFCGVKKSGSVVVCWNGARQNLQSRRAALMAYAKGG